MTDDIVAETTEDEKQGLSTANYIILGFAAIGVYQVEKFVVTRFAYAYGDFRNKLAIKKAAKNNS
jgi:hypothetical protein